jgi:hypothetical protein
MQENELIGILDRAKLYDWHFTMLAQGRELSLYILLEGHWRKYKQLYHTYQHFKEVEKMAGRVKLLEGLARTSSRDVTVTRKVKQRGRQEVLQGPWGGQVYTNTVKPIPGYPPPP